MCSAQLQEVKHNFETLNHEFKAQGLKLQEAEARTQELLYERSEIACTEVNITDLRNEIEELLVQMSSMQQNFAMKHLDFKTSENQNKRAILQLQELVCKYRTVALKLTSVLKSKGQSKLKITMLFHDSLSIVRISTTAYRNLNVS